MALSLFQWIGLGLAIALILIPSVRWFWKRFDMPSKFAIETIRQQKKDAAEARMWESIEAKVQAEEIERKELEFRQKQKEASSGKSLDAEQSADVWNKLGVKAPIQPVKRQKSSVVGNSTETNQIDLTIETALPLDKNTEEPDWELIEKMSNLSQPTEGVPEAPDLGPLDD